MLRTHYTSADAGDGVGEERLARSAPARLFNFERFARPVADESQPSTAQSSRSQSPDNTDMDNSEADNSDADRSDADNSDAYNTDVDAGLEHVAKLLGGRAARAARSAASKPARRRIHINDLPVDVVPIILFYLDTPDLLALMLVQRHWHALVVPSVWFKPRTASSAALEGFAAVLAAPPRSLIAPYAQHVARLNLSAIGRYVHDRHVLKLARCTNLKRLVLSRCDKISPRAVQRVLRDAPGLWMLELDDVPIDDGFLHYASRACKNLQVLYVSSDLISDAGLAALAEIGPSLRRVRFKGCKKLTLNGVHALAVACPNLVELDIAELACFSALSPVHDSLTDLQVRDILMTCTSLRTLKIGPSPRLSEAAFNRRQLRMLRLTSLRELILSCCSNLTDDGVLRLTEAAPRLRHLNLSRCHQITDRSLEYIAGAFGPFLDYLHVGHCLNVTDKGVIIIAQYCPKLSFFDAANCSNLTDHSIVQLARLPRLKRIGIVKCMGITDRSVEAIAEHLRGVERLHLSYCAAITPYSVRTLLLSCRSLIHLSLTGVPAFMTEDIRRMAREPPSDLSEHQRQVFCVFGELGVSELRRYLKNTYIPMSEIEESAEAAEQRLTTQTHVHEVPLFDELDGEDNDESVALGPEIQSAALWARRHGMQASISQSRDGSVRFGPRDVTPIVSLARQLEALTTRPVPSEVIGQLLRGPAADERRRQWDNADIGAADFWSAHEGESNTDESGLDAGVEDGAGPWQLETTRTHAVPLSQLRMHRFRMSVRGAQPQAAPLPNADLAASADASEPPAAALAAAPTGPLEGTELPPQ